MVGRGPIIRRRTVQQPKKVNANEFQEDSREFNTPREFMTAATRAAMFPEPQKPSTAVTVM